jgi:hypothetical protein
MLMTSFTTSSRRIFSLVCLDLFVYDFFLLYYRSPLCLESLFSRNLAVPSVNYPFSSSSSTSDMMSAGEAMGSSAKKMVAVSSSASVVAKALATGAKLVDCSHTITPKTLTFAQVFDLLPGQDGQKTQGFKQV